AALKRYQSMARFVVPESESELLEMLNAPMEKWRVFLHSYQRRLVEGMKSGPVRVLGGAGTGETVVAMHRYRWLVRSVVQSQKKILFTTFTRNLAVDIRRNLESICSSEELSRIEVVNLDQWVQRFLRKHAYDFEVTFDDQVLQDLWNVALSEKPASEELPDKF